MRRFGLILAACLGLAATAVPASADVTYVLNCDDTSCSPEGNFGSVTLHQTGTGVAGSSTNHVVVTVNLVTVMNNFAGTGAGFAINWNVTSNPSLTTAILSSPVPAGATYDPTHFTIKDNTVTGKTYKASPFSDDWMYAIDYNQNGGNANNDDYLIFDVTKSNGLLISDFVAVNGFFFAVDIFQGPNGPTFVVASNRISTPEPGTVFMLLAGMGSLLLLQRRRQMMRPD